MPRKKKAVLSPWRLPHLPDNFPIPVGESMITDMPMEVKLEVTKGGVVLPTDLRQWNSHDCCRVVAVSPNLHTRDGIEILPGAIVWKERNDGRPFKFKGGLYVRLSITSLHMVQLGDD